MSEYDHKLDLAWVQTTLTEIALHPRTATRDSDRTRTLIMVFQKVAFLDSDQKEEGAPASQ